MAIAFDAVTFYQNNGAVGTTVSANHTLAAGAVLLVFPMYFGDTPTVSSVSWNTSEALTQLQATVDDSGGVISANACYMIHNGTSGTHAVSVTYSATGGGYQGFIAISYTGVETSSLANAHRAVTHGASPISVTSQGGDLVVAGVASYNAGTQPVAAGGATQRGATTQIGTSSYRELVEDLTASGASTSMSVTSDAFDTLIGVALIPASAGGGGVTYPELERHTRGVGRGVLSAPYQAPELAWFDEAA